MPAETTPSEHSPVETAPPPAVPVQEAPVSDSPSPPGETTPGSQEELEDYEPLTPELAEEEAIRGDFVLRWAVILLALLLGSTRIGETQTLVHVKTGQYLAAHGVLPPANDVFSYTATDRPWTNLSWGFDLLAAGVHALGSFTGLSIFKALIAGLTFALIVAISRPGLPTWWGSICAALALLASHERLTVQPALMTLLGTALVLWIWFRAQQPAASPRMIWWLVPLFLIWGNLDSRAFLGLAIVFLYGAGDSLGAALGLATARPAGERQRLWLAAGGSLAALLVNPFGYRALLAPRQLFGVEYPATRDYIQGVYLQKELRPDGPRLVYFPMTSEDFWTQLDLAAVAGLAILAAAIVVFILNRRRFDLGQGLMFVGAAAFAVVTLHELPYASLVAAALATLNGQDWYAAACRQAYSIATVERVFSNGGRAATVIALAMAAFFGGTGRLRDIGAPRTGWGLDASLQTTLDDLASQLAGDKSLDHKPFHSLLAQGDQLIWVGEQVFADNRIAVYYDPVIDDNLLARHLQTREALRQPSDRKPGASRRTAWKAPFNDFGITHVVQRLSTESPGGADYLALAELLHDERNWQLVSLGAAAAVMYRKDLKDDDALQEFLGHRSVDFQQLGFRTPVPDKDLITERSRWVQPASFYQKYFWSQKREIPRDIQEALHLVRLAGLPLPQQYAKNRAAMAYLAIRKAQAGLQGDPDSAAGYLALGQAYQQLAEWDAQMVLNGTRTPFAGTRYMQAVTAYNQALIADPDNQTAHLALFALYRGAQRRDLALRHMEALERLWQDNLSINPDDLVTLTGQIEELKKALDKLDVELALAPEGDAGRQERVGRSLQNGCVLRALKEVDAEAAAMSGNLDAERLRIGLLLEAGRVEEAQLAAERYAEPAKRAGMSDWATIVALAHLPNANYVRAAQLLSEDAEHHARVGLNTALLSLPPRPSNFPWPLGTMRTAYDLLFVAPATVAARRMESGLLALEEGQPARAAEHFREALRVNPESSNRPLIAYYLYVMTDEEIDLLPPSELIPALFAEEES